MNSTHLDDHSETGHSSSRRLPVTTTLLMVALVGGVYLMREHWNHVAGNWVYLLLLACPVMHLLHGHGGHGSLGDQGDQPEPPHIRKE